MEAQWIADRTMLRTLLRTQPTWRVQDLAEALGRSRSWVKKWTRRLRAAPDDPHAVFSRSRARHHPPPTLAAPVIARILDIRDHPPANLQRTPGPKTILYFLHHDRTQLAADLYLPRSTRTIWRVLRHHGRIPSRSARQRTPLERPTPLTVWQLDFKDASSVPAAPDGKQQHVVEVLNAVDAGSSVLIAAQVRDDFTADTTLQALADTFRVHGLPDRVTVDRDPRFVGSTRQRDCPSPLERFCLCLGVAVTVLPPRRPDLNCYVERYHRAFEEECLRIFRPGDRGQVQDVTATFSHHYNWERPHQGAACGNQPPLVALAQQCPALPPRPRVPAIVDPDRWVEALDGQRYVRKVGRDSRVVIDGVPYFVSRTLIGTSVTVRVDAAAREFVVEAQERDVKRLPIKGLGNAPMDFDAYVAWMSAQARTDQAPRQRFGSQLRWSWAA
jgi:hypothetical protein